MSPPEESAGKAFEEYPLSRPEYIAALVHLYRGEMTRANVWRTRLDTTTNWAVVTVLGLLSYAFSSADHTHVSLLVGIVMVNHFLLLEARRYRIFDVWHARVRMIEENFYGPLLRRDLASPIGGWGGLVAADLLHPRFKISYLQAYRARLMRNYTALFALLIVAWVAKTSLHPISVFEGGELWANMALGPVPGWVIAGLIGLFYLFLAAVAALVRRVQAPEAAFLVTESPADSEAENI